MPLQIELGVKADPIEYRYSYDWLFRILAEEGIRHLQFGSFFEAYQLPDAWVVDLRKRVEGHGICISSVFTAHRELGGFFRCEPGWDAVARRNYERLIEIGALMGARFVGSNPGAVLRDRMTDKAQGIACYMENMKGLLHHAHACGIDRLTIEPMSCLAEPPTLPAEIDTMASELQEYHQETPGTAGVGYCADVSHGYADSTAQVRHGHLELIACCLPWLVELHLKNTDGRFCSTFGFSDPERKKGIVDLPEVLRLLQAGADRVPVNPLIAYLEIGGPKLGRDYSDIELEADLRASLQHIKEVFSQDATISERTATC
ncbi:MAG: TIM barrel protein [Candidatus Hydrogenedentes bacterium]|nr:TIM barrel protein [Candidatus Hydrogenedentota bacterium]